MPMKGNGSTALREIDRFEGGVGWIAYPDEAMERASHALATDDGLWLVDPVDADGLDDLLAEFGDVAGVVVCLDRHKRDAAKIARRHDVAVHLPTWMSGVASKIDAPIERFTGELGESGYELFEIRTSSLPPWQEAGLHNPDTGTLVVPESVGTADYFLTDGERLGVHPMLRLSPPRDALDRYSPDRILVGHGDGVLTDAASALDTALSTSTRDAASLYGKTVKQFLLG
ncbi:hypothetical protein halTADL_0357 [Halohasta litchfieldiae]|jgi:hypothetical protein|uniref:Glyoxylase, beta-lactamase superfamily II n=1 Tax=Halohasta litchfieldiae TaxID=1073996 RepID=A0A1H6U3B7_9EURY|nr:hypothetical protein [Halohasta litchfieldiae]ATW87172.1 hypothetical protein halTADL_0357 [Halohasta litchfieldiae]SEI84067.1 hypothetical protein SAMN05444271_10949 [Halohasta litchfieldiae]